MANEPNYSSNPSKDEPKKEKVRVIPLEYIDEFPGHPFKVLDDESMQKLMNSIEEIGVQSPIVARIKEDQRYEIISGHRRVHACRRLGLKLIPAIVRDLSRDEAIIAMVDANLQREHILPSEKAAAYKMKMDALKRKGKRTDLTSSPVATKLDTASSIGETAGDSRDQVFRYVRLNELVPELLEMVDRESIAFRPAVELSYLSEDEQRNLVETIDSEEATPSLSQAIRMKKLSQEGKLDNGQDILHHDRGKAQSGRDSEIQVGRTLAFLPGAHTARTDPADHLQTARRMAEVQSTGKTGYTPQS